MSSVKNLFETFLRQKAVLCSEQKAWIFANGQQESFFT